MISRLLLLIAKTKTAQYSNFSYFLNFCLLYDVLVLCEDSTILLLDDLQPKEAPSQKYRQISFYGSAAPSKISFSLFCN